MNPLRSLYSNEICYSPRWHIYDRMIRAIPEYHSVIGILAGVNWLLVKSTAGTGIAKMPPGKRVLQPPDTDRFIGLPLRAMTVLVKSWNPFEAAAGVSALNSYHNSPENIRRFWKINPGFHEKKVSVAVMKKESYGCDAAVSGTLSNQELFELNCILTVLEQFSHQGDIPDFATEYIQNNKNYLIVTETMFVNKMLPYPDTCGHDSRIVLVGPGVPLAPLWKEWGSILFTGMMVSDSDKLWKYVALNNAPSILKHGVRSVRLKAG